MRFILVLLFAMISLMGSPSSAFPATVEDVENYQRDENVLPSISVVNDEDLINHVEEVVQHLRSKRATCDILSGFGVNHSACAIHCVLRFRGGGHCNARGVCICR